MCLLNYSHSPAAYCQKPSNIIEAAPIAIPLIASNRLAPRVRLSARRDSLTHSPSTATLQKQASILLQFSLDIFLGESRIARSMSRES